MMPILTMIKAIHIGVAAGVISTILAVSAFLFPSETPIVIEQAENNPRKNFSVYTVALVLSEEDGCPSKNRYTLFVYTVPELINKPITIEYSLDNVFWDHWMNVRTDNNGEFASDEEFIPNIGDIVYVRAKFLGDDEYNPVVGDPFMNDRTKTLVLFDELCERID